ncbi:MAG: hypothetical protein DVB23_002780, partial [Verrucomicrobia bacterium]
GQEPKLDPFLEAAVATRADQPQVLLASARAYHQAIHYAQRLAGLYTRQWGPFDSSHRDRVRTLQLLQQAMPHVAKLPVPSQADFWSFLAEVLNPNPTWDAWRLQSLTDLTKLPDYDESSGPRFGWSRGDSRHAPVDEDGNPIFHSLPTSWENSKSDGERWRWALQSLGLLGPDSLAQAQLNHADLLRAQFDVQTLASSWFQPGDGSDERTELLARKFRQLGEDQTIAMLATGPKSFRLPDEHNFIRIYRTVSRSQGASPAFALAALDRLTEIHLARDQRPQAAEDLREAIRRAGPDSSERQTTLKQLTGAFGRFSGTRLEAAGEPVKTGYIFRNATGVEFTARAIDFQRLLTDVKAYLRSSPEELDWNRINLDSIGYRMIEADQQKYVGAEVARWSVALDPLEDHLDRFVEIATPLQKAGAYWLQAQAKDGNKTSVVVWISDSALVRKPLNGKFHLFVGDARTGAPVAGAEIECFGYERRPRMVNRERLKTEIQSLTLTANPQGQAIVDLSDRKEWLITARKEGLFAFLGFSGLWHRAYTDSQPDEVRVFAITDRPVYRPGDRVRYKVWLGRSSYAKDLTGEFNARAIHLEILSPNGERIHEANAAADAFGGISGEFTLAPNAPLGPFSLAVTSNEIAGGGQFRVEEYKKPEFEVIVESPGTPVPLGEIVTLKATATYYFGAPVTKGEATIKILRKPQTRRIFPSRPWDWLYGNGYAHQLPEYLWYPGWNQWGCFAPRLAWIPWNTPDPELIRQETVPLGPDGSITIRIDTTDAKEQHGDQDHLYDVEVSVTDESRRQITGSGSVIASRAPFEVFLSLDRGYYQAGDTIQLVADARTPDGKPVNGDAKARLFRVTYDATGQPAEEEVETASGQTRDGQHTQSFTAAAAGQYRAVCEVSAAGHLATGGRLFVVRGQGAPAPASFRFNDLELVPDRPSYQPGETVRLLINAARENATVLLFARPSGGVYLPPLLLNLQGKSTVHEIPVLPGDQPNFFLEAYTVSGGQVHQVTIEIPVPPTTRALQLTAKPDKEDYRPREKATLNLKLAHSGNPVAGQVVVAIYDQALEAIAGGSNVPPLLAAFWDWKRLHDPVRDDNLERRFPDLPLTPDDAMRQFGLGLSGSEELGGGALVKSARRVGHSAMPMPAPMAAPMVAEMAAAAPPADAAKSQRNGGHLAAEPDGAASSPTAVPMIRSDFADSIFWAAALITDQGGEARVSFDVPDNLTSWKIKAWAMGPGTRVGEGEAEFTTSKKLLLRPQAPRFFVEKDEVVLSANVHNYLTEAAPVEISLELDGPALTAIDGSPKSLRLAPGAEQRVDWKVRAAAEGTATIRMKALSSAESDAVQVRYPVLVHGMLKTDSWSGALAPAQESARVALNIPTERRPEQSKLQVRWSPSIAAAMVDALPYLIDYPYGCTEQTVNRFVPAVITRKVLTDAKISLADIRKKAVNLNPQQLGDARDRAAQWKQTIEDHPVFNEQRLDRLIVTGLKKLTWMQNPDGGWGWFTDESSPHTTAIVVDGLQRATAAGVPVPPDLLDRGRQWLADYQAAELARLHLPATEAAHKSHADSLDALVASILSVPAPGNNAPAMLDALYKDRLGLSPYAQALLGSALHAADRKDERDMIRRNLEQFLVTDAENQTAWLKFDSGNTWWHWYADSIETQAAYLQLLVAIDPASPTAPGLVKYLLNNRRHGSYWNSTRDTALCIEAIAAYFQASGESAPDLNVDVVLDGKVRKSIRITPADLFSYESGLDLGPADLADGAHTLEFRKTGKGPLYFNAYLTNFTKEDPIPATGLEVKVERVYWRLTPKDATTQVSGSRGQVIDQPSEAFLRERIEPGTSLRSGDMIEVELIIDSKNDYDYILLEDPKAAGLEPLDLRSGFFGQAGAYRELRDDKTAFFLRTLPQGKQTLTHRLRAEIPGTFSALPARISAMYAPELRGNSQEQKLSVTD